MTPLQKFKSTSVVTNENGCRLWQGRTNDGGYGFVICDGRMHMAHRLSFEMDKGPLGALDALHLCDTPACVNSDHLFSGTDVDNVADMDAKGRRVPLPGELNGTAKLTDSAVAIIRSTPSKYGSGVALANRFGVSPSAISSVRKKKGWNHV